MKVAWIVLYACCFSVAASGSTGDVADSDSEPPMVSSYAAEHVCQSKNIRNLPSELNSLSECRVIEGYLMISLIDRYNETDYDNLTFPNLVEITDFLLLYRVSGLKTLAHLFPNLRVIRGNHLVNNYALIIYDLLHLQDIGLKSLTTISRGGVRIEKNPQLCFADTVNWRYIAKGTVMEDHFIDTNKYWTICGKCPPGERFCWNSHTIQKICPESCGDRACDDELNCCDPSCLGSCDTANAKICSACRTLGVGPPSNHVCIAKCPADLYEFENRRCVTREECWNASQAFTSDKTLNLYIPFNGTCSRSCPKYHSTEVENGRRICRPCNGECKKKCQGGTVDSINYIQMYRGCGIITGTLIITILRGGENIAKELEQAFADLEEIEGALKVIRSFPLISLSFFKKLKTIRGEKMEGSYALHVVDNQNLQSLFDHPVEILAGKLFVHFNPKLCIQHIEYLTNYTTDVEDVSRYTNGDEVACNVRKLKARTSLIMHVGAIIDVTAIKYEDYRVLLGYVVHFKPAPLRNISPFDRRDVCGDGWRVEDVTHFDRSRDIVQIILTNLKPYTQYAYYVETYTIASETHGGRSDIQYFTTRPWQPDRIQKMKVTDITSSSMTVSWKPPRAPNGKLTNYVVKAQLIDADANILQQGKEDKEDAYDPTDEDDELIYVPPPHKNRKAAERAEDSIIFEDELQNIIYVKWTPIITDDNAMQRRRRNIDAASKYSNTAEEDVFPTNSRQTQEKEDEILESKMENGHYVHFYTNQINVTSHEFTLDNLKPFSLYSISVQACRDFNDVGFTTHTHCSDAPTLHRRTKKNEEASISTDPRETIFTDYSKETVLFWSLPKDPNAKNGLTNCFKCYKYECANESA